MLVELAFFFSNRSCGKHRRSFCLTPIPRVIIHVHVAGLSAVDVSVVCGCLAKVPIARGRDTEKNFN